MTLLDHPLLDSFFLAALCAVLPCISEGLVAPSKVFDRFFNFPFWGVLVVFAICYVGRFWFTTSLYRYLHYSKTAKPQQERIYLEPVDTRVTTAERDITSASPGPFGTPHQRFGWDRV